MTTDLLPAHFVYDDGGRAAAGYQGEADDCVVRAIAIAVEIPYQKVYDDLHTMQAMFFNRGTRHAFTRSGRRRTPTPRHGVFHHAYLPYIGINLGWRWTPTMGIGTGTTVHLRADELPAGRVIAKVSKHLVAVIDGVIHDTSDCSRDGTRCVYGYWTSPLSSGTLPPPSQTPEP
jgi:hypothetical protein